MYEGQFFARLRKSNGVRSQERWCRNRSFVAFACALALLSSCVVRYIVLSDPPDPASLPYYAGRAAVIIYSPILDSTRVDSLYLYRRHK